MKHTITFDLPEEKEEMLIAVHAMSWALAVWDLDQKLREYLKHGHKFKTPDETLESVREYLNECLWGRNIDLEMIS